MKKIRYTALTLALALSSVFTACKSDDEPSPVAQTPLVLTASVYDIDSETSSVWHSDQAFGVYMLDSDKTPLFANVRHLADSRGVTGYLVPENSALCLPDDRSGVDVAAYYPYDETATANGHRTTVAVRENMAADAFIWAGAVNASVSSPRVNLGFKSMLAQIKARILDSDAETARIVARLEGAPRSCAFDVVNGCYIGTPVCDSPLGVTVKVAEGAFELSAVVVASESAVGGPSLVLTALDKAGRELRRYPAIALGDLIGLENGRVFSPNTVYNLAGDLSADGVDLRYTGSSPICIMPWATDPDEEIGVIIKDKN